MAGERESKPEDLQALGSQCPACFAHTLVLAPKMTVFGAEVELAFRFVGSSPFNPRPEQVAGTIKRLVLRHLNAIGIEIA